MAGLSYRGMGRCPIPVADWFFYDHLICCAERLQRRGSRPADSDINPRTTERLKGNIMEHGLIAWLIIGAVAGWLAGVLVKGGGFGLLADILIGIVGAVIGGWLAGLLGIAVGGGILASIVTATLGAIVLLVIVRAFRRA